VSADRKYVTLEVRPSSVGMEDVFVENIVAQRSFSGSGNSAIIFTDNYQIELPNLEVRTLKTTVMLPDKGSLMLGGFRDSLRQRTHSGVPLLSHIPFLGRLFGKDGIYDENRHLMFLVSAEIVDLGERDALQ
jgi:type II secretory pathway component GspD/PulD (secretin)